MNTQLHLRALLQLQLICGNNSTAQHGAAATADLTRGGEHGAERGTILLSSML